METLYDKFDTSEFWLERAGYYRGLATDLVRERVRSELKRDAYLCERRGQEIQDMWLRRSA